MKRGQIAQAAYHLSNSVGARTPFPHVWPACGRKVESGEDMHASGGHYICSMYIVHEPGLLTCCTYCCKCCLGPGGRTKTWRVLCRLCELAVKTATCLGFKAGVLHVEAKHTSRSGPQIIEARALVNTPLSGKPRLSSKHQYVKILGGSLYACIHVVVSGH